MEITAAITRDGHQFVARCLEVEVTSQGDSETAAIENLKEALGLYFEDQGVPADLARPTITRFQLPS
jgi:predicted RNase H-like HicB family nuclease